MITIAVANQKGGCGKTTTAVNLGAALAQIGQRVLLLDLDPQAHSTLGFGHNPEAFDKTIYDILIGHEFCISNVIVSTHIPGLDIIPNNILLSGADIHLASMYEREYVLNKHLARISSSYDFCIIDCSPSLNLMTLNALVASTEVIIPVQTHYYAIEGLKQLLETIEIVRERFNSDIRIMGILLTFVESNTALSRQVQQQMRSYFGDLVFNTVIHRNIRLAEAPGAGQSVITYAPRCKGAVEYKCLAEEIVNVKAKDRLAQRDFSDIQRNAVAC